MGFTSQALAAAIMACCLAVPAAIRSLGAKAYSTLRRVFAMGAMFIPNATAWNTTPRLIFAKAAWLTLRDAMERSITLWSRIAALLLPYTAWLLKDAKAMLYKPSAERRGTMLRARDAELIMLLKRSAAADGMMLLIAVCAARIALLKPSAELCGIMLRARGAERAMLWKLNVGKQVGTMRRVRI
jgi:hypothetical protein